MQSKILFSFVVCTFLLTVPNAAEAYIGPGAGIAAIGTVIALIGGIILAIVAFFWYPVKRLLAKIKKNKKSPQDPSSS